MTTVRVTDFGIEDMNPHALQLLKSDIEAFPRQVTNITVPRQTIVRLLEVALKAVGKDSSLSIPTITPPKLIV